MQVDLVLFGGSRWVWTPILGKRGHNDATRRVPGATLQFWDFCFDVCAETVRNHATAGVGLAPARIPSRQK